VVIRRPVPQGEVAVGDLGRLGRVAAVLVLETVGEEGAGGAASASASASRRTRQSAVLRERYSGWGRPAICRGSARVPR
jgi:hypothetical protein